MEDQTPGQSSSGETITDIQNYLETFNKEIEGGDNNVTQVKFETGKFKTKYTISFFFSKRLPFIYFFCCEANPQ